MKNKVELKKMLIISIITIIIFSILFAFISLIQYHSYTRIFNEKLNAIITNLVEEYPNLSKDEIILILNNSSQSDEQILREYGINLNKDSLVLENDTYFKKFIIINCSLVITFGTILLVIFGIYIHKKNKTLEDIVNYIEQINRRNYKLDIDDNTEDELSILKNEIYKVTIMLKETAENAKSQKLSLKNSLEDISHQLKTPLTSIMIMLDNIIDNPSMDETTKNEFIKDCKKEIKSINFLVQSLLKLSRFDADTIEFNNQKVTVKKLIEESIQKVSVLCDLKNIEIVTNGDLEDTINCDIKWQVEAITNLLKNAVEYSENNSKIEVNYSTNSIYMQINIKDYGKGIDEKDLSHIFERFYKGKNSSNESVGIGLALAKTIIEKNNGRISVKSKIGEGTEFIIKYFSNT